MQPQRQSDAAQRIADSILTRRAAFFRVLGASMSPAIPAGSIVHVIAADFGAVLPGSIIAFSRWDRIFVHRVTAVIAESGELRLITRGDALSVNDPLVSSEEFLGLVTAIIPPRRRGLASRCRDHVRGARRRLQTIFRVVRQHSVGIPSA